MNSKITNERKKLITRLSNIQVSDTDNKILTYKNVNILVNSLILIDNVNSIYGIDGETILSIRGLKGLELNLTHEFNSINVRIMYGVVEDLIKNKSFESSKLLPCSNSLRLLEDSNVILFFTNI